MKEQLSWDMTTESRGGNRRARGNDRRPAGQEDAAPLKTRKFMDLLTDLTEAVKGKEMCP